MMVHPERVQTSEARHDLRDEIVNDLRGAQDKLADLIGHNPFSLTLTMAFQLIEYAVDQVNE